MNAIPFCTDAFLTVPTSDRQTAHSYKEGYLPVSTLGLGLGLGLGVGLGLRKDSCSLYGTMVKTCNNPNPKSNPNVARAIGNSCPHEVRLKEQRDSPDGYNHH